MAVDEREGMWKEATMSRFEVLPLNQEIPSVRIVGVSDGI